MLQVFKRPLILGLSLSLYTLGLLPALAQGTTEPVRVVASFSILADLVQQVGGDRVQVKTLVGAGADAHTFNPSPRDSVQLTQAQLIVKNGLGFDTWIDPLIKSSETKARVLVAGKSIKPIMVSGDNHTHDHGHSHSHDDEYPDPHYWHDPKNLLLVVGSIRDELANIDPAGATYYGQRAESYSQQIRDLDAWIQAEVRKIPEKSRKLVTSHDSLTYMARRYGFRVVNTALASVSTEAAEPNAARLAEVIRSIKKEKVPAIFYDTTHSNRLMERIAEEANVRLAPSLYTDAIGVADSGVTTTLGLLRHNMVIITRELAPKP